MLASERRATLLALLRARGATRIDTLANELRVSAMTVRRDVEVLVAEGVAERVHGGVTAVGGRRPSDRLDAAISTRKAEKEAIADAALSLIEPGAVVGLSGGSSAWYLAKRLIEVPGLTVVTNSLSVVELFDDAVDGVDVILTGGVRTPSRALAGPVAVASLAGLHCDITFLSVHGIHPEAGLTTPNILEAETNRALAASAARTAVLADHTKWQTVSLTTVVDLSQVDILITDEGMTEADLIALRGLIPEVRVAHLR